MFWSRQHQSRQQADRLAGRQAGGPDGLPSRASRARWLGFWIWIGEIQVWVVETQRWRAILVRSGESNQLKENCRTNTLPAASTVTAAVHQAVPHLSQHEVLLLHSPESSP